MRWAFAVVLIFKFIFSSSGLVALNEDEESMFGEVAMNIVAKQLDATLYTHLQRSKREADRSRSDFGPVTSEKYSDYANETNNNKTKPTQPIDCVSSILEDFRAKVSTKIPEWNETGLSQQLLNPGKFGVTGERHWFGFFNVKTFETFCTIFKDSRKKLDVCANSTALTITLESLAIVDFMCISKYQEVVKYGACLQKTSDEEYEPCKKNCSKFQYENSRNISDIEAFDKSCSYVECQVKCESPIIEANCKKGAKDLVEDAIRAIFVSLQDIFVNKLKIKWPKSCQSLTKIKI